jgi:hypothetical protein
MKHGCSPGSNFYAILPCELDIIPGSVGGSCSGERLGTAQCSWSLELVSLRVASEFRRAAARLCPSPQRFVVIFAEAIIVGKRSKDTHQSDGFPAV